MNKKELIKIIAEDTGFKKSKCRSAVNTSFELISKELMSGKDIFINGFGKFKLKRKRCRIFNDGAFININPPEIEIVFETDIKSSLL
ncbi:MAG: HU family DNA-binding protein [Ignavibacteria bacterium]|nr:HU family DNA-binding protein [Ignavibacteria bacterium]